MQSIVKLLKGCHATRFGLYLANQMNVLRSYSKGPLSPKELIEEIYKYETVKANGKYKVARLQPKPMEALLIALDAMAVLQYKDGKVYWILTDEEIQLCLKETKDIDPLLMSCKTLVLNAFREGGPDAKTFSKEMKGIREFETQQQKIIISGIVKDIRRLYQSKKDELKGISRKLRIVDIGCGEGRLDYALAEEINCGEINACDTNEDVLETADAGKPKHLKHLTFTKTPKWKNGEVDVVILVNVLHDAEEPDKLIRQVSDLLQNHGIAIIVDPVVSTDRDKNFLKPHAVTALCMGFFGCVLSTNCDHAKGPATGKEQLYQYIVKNHLIVVNDKLLAGSKFYHGFIAAKWDPSKKSVDDWVFEITNLMK